MSSAEDSQAEDSPLDETSTSHGDANRNLPPSMKSLLGTSLGKYRIVRAVGHGSMGVVFEAHDEKLGRSVALKVLPPGLGATEKAILRFLREAKAVARLNHENIVPIYEIGQMGSTHFYAMQLLEGRSLDKVLKEEGALPGREVARLICAASRAVHFAHQRGIIHRDVKPANMILCDDGKLVLTDFGLARPERGAGITDSGAMVGTPLYMSPEQVRANKEVDRRTDIYSLGVTMHEMLVGAPPFKGHSTQEILQKILDIEPPPLRTVNKSVPVELEVVALRCMEKAARRRYASALELAQDLERYLEHEPILARRANVASRVIKKVRKHSTTSILSGALIAAIVTSAVLFAVFSKGKQAQQFETVLGQAINHAENDLNLSALDSFEQALGIRPQDSEALFGKACALYRSALAWEEAETVTDGGKALKNLLVAYGPTPEAVFKEALRVVNQVLAEDASHPEARLIRGAIKLQMPEREVRLEGIADIVSAGESSGGDRRVLADLVRIRWELARDPTISPDLRDVLLHQALTYARKAVELCDQQLKGATTRKERDLLTNSLARLYHQRAAIYLELLRSSGQPLYYELCIEDAELAKSLKPEEDIEGVVSTARSLVEERVAAVPGDTGTPAEEGIDEDNGAWMNLYALLAAPEPSQKSEALLELVKVGGAFLGTQWEATEDTRNDLLAKISQGFAGPNSAAMEPVSQSDRELAAQKVNLARMRIQASVGSDVDLVVARGLLEEAIQLNPANATYHGYLANVYQSLNLFELALQSSAMSLTLAPDDPVFIRADTLLVLDAIRREEPAKRKALLARARVNVKKLLELSPNQAEFLELAKELGELEGPPAPSTGPGAETQNSQDGSFQ